MSDCDRERDGLLRIYEQVLAATNAAPANELVQALYAVQTIVEQVVPADDLVKVRTAYQLAKVEAADTARIAEYKASIPTVTYDPKTGETT